MDAVSLLTQHIDVDKVLQHYDFDKVRSDGDFIRSCCKMHGGNNPSGFVISRDTGLWFCHTGGCGGGDLFHLIQHIDKCGFEESVKKLASILGVSIDGAVIVQHKSKRIKQFEAWMKLLKEKNVKREELPEYIPDVEVKQVTKFRSFLPETLEKFKLGYVEEIELAKRSGDTYTIRNRLAFPIIERGRQVGISYRRVKSTDVPKWSHQPAHIQTKHLLYNYDQAIGAERVVVVEGIPDVWAFDEIGATAVATFGAHLTDEQYALLIKCGADIVLAYDGDDAGRRADEKARKLLRNKTRIQTVPFREGEDPESIPREELRKRYEARR